MAAVGTSTLLPRSRPASAADPAPASASSGVVVDGLGKVTGTPDVLTANLRVSVRRNDFGATLTAANGLQAKITAILKKDGVVKASSSSVSRQSDLRPREKLR